LLFVVESADGKSSRQAASEHLPENVSLQPVTLCDDTVKGKLQRFAVVCVAAYKMFVFLRLLTCSLGLFIALVLPLKYLPTVKMSPHLE
jgi:hypothetical protein